MKSTLRLNPALLSAELQKDALMLTFQSATLLTVLKKYSWLTRWTDVISMNDMAVVRDRVNVILVERYTVRVLIYVPWHACSYSSPHCQMMTFNFCCQIFYMQSKTHDLAMVNNKATLWADTPCYRACAWMVFWRQIFSGACTAVPSSASFWQDSATILAQ